MEKYVEKECIGIVQLKEIIKPSPIDIAIRQHAGVTVSCLIPCTSIWLSHCLAESIKRFIQNSYGVSAPMCASG
ncbi:hypothetical protein XELAEV_18040057mg [Xenopus laevis]|uniref:Uncharacterized protein n=1 Tax=Xenopus laevis TaxID=8355 RepID=A0A974C911_XENLA|nr:hypothetical protein XELAEV_18040057mg [Xenopus laevis]